LFLLNGTKTIYQCYANQNQRRFSFWPAFVSRKRVTDTLGNLPEQLAASFDGNLAILHFDKQTTGAKNKPANNDSAIL
jgi:hypothetical protein